MPSLVFQNPSNARHLIFFSARPLRRQYCQTSASVVNNKSFGIQFNHLAANAYKKPERLGINVSDIHLPRLRIIAGRLNGDLFFIVHG